MNKFYQLFKKLPNYKVKHLFEYNVFEDWLEEPDEARFINEIEKNFIIDDRESHFTFLFMYYDGSIEARDGILSHAKSTTFDISDKKLISTLIKTHDILTVIQLLEKSKLSSVNSVRLKKMKDDISRINEKDLHVGLATSIHFEFKDKEIAVPLVINFESVTFPNDELRMIKIGRWNLDAFQETMTKYNLRKKEEELNGSTLCRLLIEKYIL